jgi:hypothetical protein
LQRRQQQAEEQARQARANQSAAEQNERQARERMQREVDRLQAARAAAVDKWTPLAAGLETVEALMQFFARRQPQGNAGTTLRIDTAVRVSNDRALSSFASTRSFDINPLQAHGRHADSILFHGTSEAAVANIQATGRPSLRFAANGMLGRGIYGAPDPRKSLQYCRNSPNGTFMFVCRFNLSAAQHAGPTTQHRNSVFDEFAVFNDDHVVVLWMLKLA